MQGLCTKILVAQSLQRDWASALNVCANKLQNSPPSKVLRIDIANGTLNIKSTTQGAELSSEIGAVNRLVLRAKGGSKVLSASHHFCATCQLQQKVTLGVCKDTESERYRSETHRIRILVLGSLCESFEMITCSRMISMCTPRTYRNSVTALSLARQECTLCESLSWSFSHDMPYDISLGFTLQMRRGQAGTNVTLHVQV
jgi:hypothetical protein